MGEPVVGTAHQVARVRAQGALERVPVAAWVTVAAAVAAVLVTVQGHAVEPVLAPVQVDVVVGVQANVLTTVLAVPLVPVLPRLNRST